MVGGVLVCQKVCEGVCVCGTFYNYTITVDMTVSLGWQIIQTRQSLRDPESCGGKKRGSKEEHDNENYSGQPPNPLSQKYKYCPEMGF